MYLEYFNFTDEPFKITPDSKYLYLSRQHEEVLQALLYGITQRKGFMAVIGDIGTGKTTISRALLNRLDKSIDTSIILNPMLSVQELLEAINDDFGNAAATRDTVKGQIDALNEFMLRRLRFNKNAIVMIDEAQHLSVESMEMLRLLSNLETEDKKLMQIIFLGQKELETKLKSPELRQLDQRIGIRYFLGPLNYTETCNYIVHRITMAGGGGGSIQLEERGLRKIFEYSKGVPRRVNMICDRSLLEAFAQRSKLVTSGIVKAAIRDIEGLSNPSGVAFSGRKKVWEFWKWF
ncbi:MAG: AAA family ATPase [Deltaproteobacteria bacterium]|nr:AAA family ATPase [Deltaproteobacteria bacterium]